MASERDLELLDEYLANRLKGNDKTEFETRLQQDPDLQSELSFQQQIAAGIRKVRAAELKAMLNNVPIPALPTSGSSTLTWAAAGVVVAIGVAVLVTKHSQQQTASKAVVEKIEAPVNVNPEVKSEQATPPTTQPEPAKVADVEKKKPLKKESPATAKTEPKKLEVFDPTQEADVNEEPAMPEQNLAGESTKIPSARTVTVDNDNKKYKFHYQLEGNNLTLYGDFEKNLYTIMEFNSDERQTVVFMFYKNNYYLLDQTPGSIKRLVPVNDPVLLDRLRQQRTHE